MGQRIASQAYQTKYAPYSDVLDYLQVNSGVTSRSMLALGLYSTLKSQEEWGLQLPEWADSVWPEPISTITKMDWEELFSTSQTRALGAGKLFFLIFYLF